MANFYTNVLMMGDKVLYRGIENGKRVKRRIEYKPKLYTPSQGKSRFRTLQNVQLDEIQFDSIKDHKEFKQQYEQVENFKIYGDFRHDYAYISDAFPDDIEWDLSKLVVAYIDIEVGSENGFPEPDAASEPVTAIAIHVGGKFYVFGCGDFSPAKCTSLSQATRDAIVYKKCIDEKDLIRKFVGIWTQHMPDLVTGWNSNDFDWPYLINRMERLFMGSDGEDLIKTLSPWNWIKSRVKHVGKKEINYYDIAGVALIDYMDLYKKYPVPMSQESWKLDYIASVEVGTQKIDYSQYEDLYTLYKRDFQLFIEYNVRDVELVMMIEAKNRLLELAFTLAYDSRVNYEDVFSQVRMWDSIIYNYLKKKNIILPTKKETAKKEQFIGAYVKDPKPGMYKWVASFDFTSLYPHLIMMFNLSPETLVEPTDYDQETEDWFDENRHKINVDNMLVKGLKTDLFKRKKVCLTPNGQLFRTDRQGFLAELMERMYKDRAHFKNLQNEAERKLQTTTDLAEQHKLKWEISRCRNLQMAKKVCLNSAFGAIGNQYFRFFDVRIAEAITLSAQLSIIWIQRKLNKHLDQVTGHAGHDYVIASDTDSVYVTFEDVVNKAWSKERQRELGSLAIIRSLDAICEKSIAPQIDAFCEELGEYVNAYSQRLIMKREALADKAIWVRKKHYMINIYNNEGVEYTKPKLKIVGMAAIKSSTPGICRKKVKEVFELIMNKDEADVRKYVADFHDEFVKLPVQDIAFPLGMSGLEDYDGGDQIFKAKTPIHVRGALMYNHWLNEMKLSKKYQTIKEGEKLKYVYLKEPNPLQSNVISFTTVIPKEFDLEKYIDFETMYQKTFVEQVTRVTNAIGWSLEEVSSLEGLFS